ncbi:MAG: hypothetical protein CME62_02500 [Halobacteriovoraceae bacterium]|nr:hypothetical protein [Halobacteriovoraceae bacterium]
MSAKKILNNQSGFSLIEVVAASAVALVMSLAVMKTNETASKGMRTMDDKMQAQSFTNSVYGHLLNGDKCGASTFATAYDWRSSTDGGSPTVTGGETPPYGLSGDYTEWGIGTTTPLQLTPQVNGDDPNFRYMTTSSGSAWEQVEIGHFVPGTSNWKVRTFRYYNQDANGNCYIMVEAEKAAKGDSSFGADNRKFWLKMNCELDTASGNIDSCAMADSVAQGLFQTNDGPSGGIMYSPGDPDRNPVIISVNDPSPNVTTAGLYVESGAVSVQHPSTNQAISIPDGYSATYGTGNDGAIFFDGTDFNVNTSAGDLLLNPAGNVGIGTTNPLSKLQVSNGDIRIQGSSGKLMIDSDGDANWGTIAEVSGGLSFSGTNDPIGTSHLFVANGGQVGINTTSPAPFQLNVNGNTNIDGTLDTDGITNVGNIVSTNNITTTNGSIFANNGSVTADGNIFTNNGNIRSVNGNVRGVTVIADSQLTLTSGSASINGPISDPDSNLELDDSVDISGNLTVAGIMSGDFDGNPNFPSGIRLNGVGISSTGSTITTSNLTVSNYLNANNFFAWDGFMFTGEIVNFTNSSDREFKKKIETVKNPTETLKQLKGRTYFMRVDEYPDYGFKDDRQFGVIAQEVQEVLPELVQQSKHTGKLTVEYLGFIPILIEGFKEQQKAIEKNTEMYKMMKEGIAKKDKEQDKRIDELEKENKALKDEIRALSRRLIKIEKSLK